MGKIIKNGVEYSYSPYEGMPTTTITIPANGWVYTGDYWGNKVDIYGVTESDNYEIIGFTPSSTVTDNATIKTQLGYITYGDTSAGIIQFIAIDQVPTIDLPIVIRRVL